MRRALTFWLLEGYALALALVQHFGGVRTDEAKYLLNIPYPHPPLARWVLHLMEWAPFQELFWRIVLASLCVQAAWLVWDMGHELARPQRMALAGAWLACAAVAYQAGSIMMAPLTALQGLVIVWLLTKEDDTLREHAGFIALFWLASLFTAHQAVLYAPLVALLLWRGGLGFWKTLLACVVPVILLGMYSLSNPLVLASFVNAGTANVTMSALERAVQLCTLWVIGGSAVILLLGIAGWWIGRQWMHMLSFVLLSAFVYVSFRGYYAMLFTPLFFAGAVECLRVTKVKSWLVVIPSVLTTALLWTTFGPQWQVTVPARVMPSILAMHRGGDILMNGYFGHEWEYASSVPVRRYRPGLLHGAQAVICIQVCPEMAKQADWELWPNMPVQVWVRR
jgi:hypothetical protein